jgi:hypothetical protein
VAAAENPGVVLGTVLGLAGLEGRDKVTLVTSPGIHDLGAWLEQLIAESTGKNGKGLIPVDRESVGLGLLVHILVTLDDQTHDTVSAFGEAVAAMPEIIQCHMLMGDIDFLLLAVTRDLASYRKLLRERLSILPGVRGIDSRVVVEEMKNTTELPIMTLTGRD